VIDNENTGLGAVAISASFSVEVWYCGLYLGQSGTFGGWLAGEISFED